MSNNCSKERMSQLNFLITLAVAAAMGYLLYRLHVPGGMVVGAIVGVVIFNLAFNIAVMPSTAKIIAQIVSGAFIGSGISKEEIKQFKRLFIPLAILIVGMLILNLISGVLIYLTSDLDLITAMFCAVPGGMSDTPLIAAEMGADGAKVALMQFIRLCAGIGLFPIFLKAFVKKQNANFKPLDKPQKTPYTHWGFFVAAVVAASGGALGKILGVPAGALLFSLIATMTVKQFVPSSMLPGWLKRVAQVLAGAYIGVGISPKDIPEMKNLLVPALLMLLGYFVACVILGRLLSRYSGLTVAEGMLAATPAGASDMALISADIGISSPEVIILQIGRMLSAIMIFPNIIHFCVNLF